MSYPIPTGDDKRVYVQINVGTPKKWWRVTWGKFYGYGSTMPSARRDLLYGIERYQEDNPPRKPRRKEPTP